MEEEEVAAAGLEAALHEVGVHGDAVEVECGEREKCLLLEVVGTAAVPLLTYLCSACVDAEPGLGQDWAEPDVWAKRTTMRWQKNTHTDGIFSRGRKCGYSYVPDSMGGNMV